MSLAAYATETNNYSGLPFEMHWKLSSKARIASDFSTLLRIKQGEKRKRCHSEIGFPTLWCGRTVSRAVGVRSRDYQIFLDRVVYFIFLTMVLCCARFARGSSAINADLAPTRSMPERPPFAVKRGARRPQCLVEVTPEVTIRLTQSNLYGPFSRARN